MVVLSLIDAHLTQTDGPFFVEREQVGMPQLGVTVRPADLLVIRHGHPEGKPTAMIGAIPERTRDSDWLALSAVLCRPEIDEICIVDIAGKKARRWVKRSHPWDIRRSWSRHQPQRLADFVEDHILSPNWPAPEEIEGDQCLRLDAIDFGIPLSRLLQIAVLTGSNE